jgi:hypothetical protein
VAQLGDGGGIPRSINFQLFFDFLCLQGANGYKIDVKEREKRILNSVCKLSFVYWKISARASVSLACRH